MPVIAAQGARDAALRALDEVSRGDDVPNFAVFIGSVDGAVVTWARVHGSGEVDELKQALSFIAVAMLGGSVTAPVARGRVSRARVVELAREVASLDWTRAGASSATVRLAVSARGQTVEIAEPVSEEGRAALDRVVGVALRVVSSATFGDPEPPAPPSAPGPTRPAHYGGGLFDDERTVAGDASALLARFAEAIVDVTLDGTVDRPSRPSDPAIDATDDLLAMRRSSPDGVLEVSEADLQPNELDDLAITRDAYPAFNPAAAGGFDEEATFAGDAGSIFTNADAVAHLASSLISDVARTHASAIEVSLREGRDPQAAVARELAEARKTFERLVAPQMRGVFDRVAHALLARGGGSSPGQQG